MTVCPSPVAARLIAEWDSAERARAKAVACSRRITLEMVQAEAGTGCSGYTAHAELGSLIRILPGSGFTQDESI